MKESRKTRNSHGLLQLGREALAYCQCASALISGNKALFVSVDLIGEKNQVILELELGHEETYFVKEHSDSKNKYSEDDIIKMLEFLFNNIFVVFGLNSFY